MGLKLFSRSWKKRSKKSAPQDACGSPFSSGAADYQPAPTARATDNPFEQAWLQERDAILFGGQSSSIGSPSSDVRARSAARLEDRLALVPEGIAALGETLVDGPDGAETEVSVKSYLLEIHPVTHARFQHFVDDGGYDELEFWPEDVWPHLIEFQDLTSSPGPRFWRNGSHDLRRSDHPVVGVCWYEAQAFARWAGTRLPTEAEWQVAASWRVKSSADLMRRFPWGDAMDSSRCNVWASGLRDTTRVTDFQTGSAPNGICQLVGNVWEWVSSDFTIRDGAGIEVIGEMAMKSLRGGAFDTYFETQATAEFRTGLLALNRSHNAGFRCAVSLEDATWLAD